MDGSGIEIEMGDMLKYSEILVSSSSGPPADNSVGSVPDDCQTCFGLSGGVDPFAPDLIRPEDRPIFKS